MIDNDIKSSIELMNTRQPNYYNLKCIGLSSKMDIVILTDSCTIYNKPLNIAQTIYINTKPSLHDLIIKFINDILPLISHPINLIIAGEDYTFPNNIDKRFPRGKFPKDKLKILLNNKYVNKIFVENLDSYLPKTYPIPLGINPEESSTMLSYFENYRNINKNKPLKFTNFNRIRTGSGQWEERGFVMNLCQNNWKDYYVETSHLPHNEYLTIMSENLFTICVHGGGLDVNPKLFESLLIGVIPIIKKNEPYTDIYLDWPVVIINDWDNDTITNENLLKWKNKYYKFFEDNNYYDKIIQYLSLDYYVKYVSTL